MRLVALALLLALEVSSAACTKARVRPPVPAGATEICETCVGTLEGVRVGVSNIWARRLAGPDGVVREQPAAQLTLWRDEPAGAKASDAGTVTVVVGSRVAIGGVVYEVVAIDDPRDQPGSIVVRPLPGAPPASASASSATPLPSTSS